MEHDCLHEKDISRLDEEVYGKDGLAKSIPRLEEKINNLVLSVADVNTSVSAHTVVISNLLLAQARLDGEGKGIKDTEAKKIIADNLLATKKRDNVYKAVSIIGFVIMIGLSILNYYLSNKKLPSQLNEAKKEINHKIDTQEGVSKVTRGGYVHYNDQGISDSIKIYK